MDWINDGEKYAIVGLQLKAEGGVGRDLGTSKFSVIADTPFSIPPHWKEWLGSLGTQNIEDCNLFLLTKCAAKEVTILNEEDKLLAQRAYRFYVGLLLSSTAVPSRAPVMLAGSRRNGEIGVRQVTELPMAALTVIHLYQMLSVAQLKAAAKVAEQIDDMSVAMSQGLWRFNRTLALYVQGRTTADIMERIHLYCRCIDGLILPDIGKTTQQFKSKTELFIGPGHHVLMGDLYAIRSAAEHLNENRYLERFDRSVRLDLAKKDAIIEWIARAAITRIITDSNLWVHFANTASLASFWALQSAERTRIWGTRIDPLAAIANFAPDAVSDSELGA